MKPGAEGNFLAAEQREKLAHGVSRGLWWRQFKPRMGRKKIRELLSPLPGLVGSGPFQRLTFWRNSVAETRLRKIK